MNTYVFKVIVFCVCDLLIFLQNRLNMNRIPFSFPRSTYSTCRLRVYALAFTRYCLTSNYCSSHYILLLPPLTCKAYPIGMLLHDHCAIYAPPPADPSPFYAIHRTILVTPISCKGQSTLSPLALLVSLCPGPQEPLPD